MGWDWDWVSLRFVSFRRTPSGGQDVDFGGEDLALLCVEVSEVCGVPKPGIIKIQLCVCICAQTFISFFASSFRSEREGQRVGGGHLERRTAARSLSLSIPSSPPHPGPISML